MPPQKMYLQLLCRWIILYAICMKRYTKRKNKPWFYKFKTLVLHSISYSASDWSHWSTLQQKPSLHPRHSEDDSSVLNKPPHIFAFSIKLYNYSSVILQILSALVCFMYSEPFSHLKQTASLFCFLQVKQFHSDITTLLPYKVQEVSAYFVSLA